MLFERQKCLLALVDSLGGDVGALDFQKLLFLYCREVETTPSYEFVPYRYGGFSFTSYADKRRLVELRLLAGEERCWKLTPAGQRVATVGPMVRMRMDQFSKRHAKLRGEALVAEAYRRHPFHAIRSEMAGRLLAGDAPALAAIQAARPPAGAPGVCTIGYEGSSLEGYLNRLLHAGVTLLCDVRRNPLSRKYGFSKSTLAKSTRDTRPETFHPVDVLDITHLGHLGTDDGWRERRQIILKQGKVHDRLGPLIDAAHANQCSLAVFKPAKILDFSWAPDDRDRDEVKVQEMRNRTDQGELFVGDADSEAFGAT